MRGMRLLFHRTGVRTAKKRSSRVCIGGTCKEALRPVVVRRLPLSSVFGSYCGTSQFRVSSTLACAVYSRDVAGTLRTRSVLEGGAPWSAALNIPSYPRRTPFLISRGMTTTETITLASIAPPKRVLPMRPKAKPTITLIDALEDISEQNNIEDFTEKDIQEAIDYVLKTSIYSGSSRDLMVRAITDTVHGRMSLTQAAAKFGIPFSTIHPYIKKLRQRLQLRDPATDSKKTRSSPKKKRTSEEAPSEEPVAIPVVPEKKPRKKRSPPPGYIPFKQIVIPDHWKLFPQKMESAVWTAVSFCNYDDMDKKHRLCQAILDVMIGQKTLKAAASNNNIPFTTLQTYFHRSRITMERCMEEDEEVQRAKPKDDPVSASAIAEKNEKDSAISGPNGTNSTENIHVDDSLAILSQLNQEQQEQIISMLFNNGEASETKDTLESLRTETSTPSTEKSNGKSVDALSDWLISKRMNEPSPPNEDNMSTSPNGVNEASGSRKRKPQVVKRVSEAMNTSTSSTGSTSNAASRFSDFLENRFGLTVMRPTKSETNEVLPPPLDEAFDARFESSAAELHHPTVTTKPAKFVKFLISYYAHRLPGVSGRAVDKLQRTLEAIIIGETPLAQLDMSQPQRDKMEKHVLTITNLMAYISEAYPVFYYHIQPMISNLASYDDFQKGTKLHHNLLRVPPPAALSSLVDEFVPLIVRYLERFASAHIIIDHELTRFLIKQVVQNRSLPELYKNSEYNALHERIVTDELLRRHAL
uniref:HTH psq-type domain-containing protein n=1 Tax=Panagrellus redivivus TaxID=6233 RepID=A0A7E4W1C4_PANRE